MKIKARALSNLIREALSDDEARSRISSRLAPIDDTQQKFVKAIKDHYMISYEEQEDGADLKPNWQAAVEAAVANFDVKLSKLRDSLDHEILRTATYV